MRRRSHEEEAVVLLEFSLGIHSITSNACASFRENIEKVLPWTRLRWPGSRTFFCLRCFACVWCPQELLTPPLHVFLPGRIIVACCFTTFHARQPLTGGRKLRCMFVAHVAMGKSYVTNAKRLPQTECPPRGYESVAGEVRYHLGVLLTLFSVFTLILFWRMYGPQSISPTSAPP